MSKSSGGLRITATPPNVNDVKTWLGRAEIDRWNRNSQYQLGIHEEPRAVIQDVAKGNKFASQVAQSVIKNNYRMSEKQAYIIAKEAVDSRNKILFDKNGTFASSQSIKKKIASEKTTKQTKGTRFPTPKEVRDALKARGVTISKQEEILAKYYNKLRDKHKGSTSDAISLFLSKI